MESYPFAHVSKRCATYQRPTFPTWLIRTRTCYVQATRNVFGGRHRTRFSPGRIERAGRGYLVAPDFRKSSATSACPLRSAQARGVAHGASSGRFVGAPCPSRNSTIWVLGINGTENRVKVTRIVQIPLPASGVRQVTANPTFEELALLRFLCVPRGTWPARIQRAGAGFGVSGEADCQAYFRLQIVFPRPLRA